MNHLRWLTPLLLPGSVWLLFSFCQFGLGSYMPVLSPKCFPLCRLNWNGEQVILLDYNIILNLFAWAYLSSVLYQFVFWERVLDVWLCVEVSSHLGNTISPTFDMSPPPHSCVIVCFCLNSVRSRSQHVLLLLTLTVSVGVWGCTACLPGSANLSHVCHTSKPPFHWLLLLKINTFP